MSPKKDEYMRGYVDGFKNGLAEAGRAKAEIAREQARWANDVVVTATGVFPPNYVVRSPCDPPLPKPDFLYIEGTVYRKEPAK